MNKSELVADVAARSGLDPVLVADVVNAAVAAITRAVAAGDRVVIQGFGTFHRQARAKRVGRDIGADRPVAVPATHVPVFRAGKAFRDAVVSRRRRRPPARPAGRTAATRRPTTASRSGSGRGGSASSPSTRTRGGRQIVS